MFLLLLFVLFWVYLVVQNRVLLCNSPACPGIHSVDLSGLELAEIFLLLPPFVLFLSSKFTGSCLSLFFLACTHTSFYFFSCFNFHFKDFTDNQLLIRRQKREQITNREQWQRHFAPCCISSACIWNSPSLAFKIINSLSDKNKCIAWYDGIWEAKQEQSLRTPLGTVAEILSQRWSQKSK